MCIRDRMDIRPGIFSLSAHDGALEFQVDASSAGNIKPYALLDALLSFAGKDTPPFWTCLLYTSRCV